MRIRRHFAWLIVGLGWSSCFILGCGSKDPIVKDKDAKDRDKVQSAMLAELRDVSGDLNALVGDVEASREKLIRFRSDVAKAPESELKSLAVEYSQFRESLPALAGIELSSELAAVDWLVKTRQLLAGELNADNLLETEVMLDQIPASVTEAIAGKLSKQVAEKTINLAMNLTESDSPDSDTLELVIELLGLLELDNQTSTESLNQIVESLTSKLNVVQQQSLKAHLNSEAENLRKQLNNVRRIVNPELQRSALVALSQSVDSIRLRFALQDLKAAEVSFAKLRTELDAELSNTLEAIDKEQASRISKARMRYQAWALDQIQQMNSYLQNDKINKELYRLRDDSAKSKKPVVIQMAEFPGVRRQIEKALGKLADNLRLSSDQQSKVSDFVSDNWYELVYQVKHDAAARFLLPVNQNLLEPPVAKFYNEAFEKVWQQIEDGEDMQLSLAKMTARIPKRSLESFVESSNE